MIDPRKSRRMVHKPLAQNMLEIVDQEIERHVAFSFHMDAFMNNVVFLVQLFM